MITYPEHFDAIARVCHEANRAWSETHGDTTQTQWDDAPQWQRDSARNGVMFHYQNPLATAGATHQNWMADKIREGWVWGEVKSDDEKTHPCLIDFDDLPEFQKAKDRIFRAICHALLPNGSTGEYDPAAPAAEVDPEPEWTGHMHYDLERARP